VTAENGALERRYSLITLFRTPWLTALSPCSFGRLHDFDRHCEQRVENDWP